jgi:guanine nucleotide-binding protein subunit alpha
MSNMDTIGQLVSTLKLISTEIGHPFKLMFIVPRTVLQGYIPSTQDILRCQSLTIGINELVVDINDALMCGFISTDGSRSLGNSWMRACVFDDVTGVLFFVAANEFDQTIPDNGATNRLRESLALFEIILNYPWFKSVPIVLILSKCDLLAEKIKVKNIRDYFSNFEVHNIIDFVLLVTVMILFVSRVIPTVLMMCRNF